MEKNKLGIKFHTSQILKRVMADFHTLNCRPGGSSPDLGEPNSVRAYITSYRVIVVWSVTIEFFIRLFWSCYAIMLIQVIFADDYNSLVHLGCWFQNIS